MPVLARVDAKESAREITGSENVPPGGMDVKSKRLELESTKCMEGGGLSITGSCFERSMLSLRAAERLVVFLHEKNITFGAGRDWTELSYVTL